MLYCKKHRNQPQPQTGCLTCAIVAKENAGTDASAHAIYHPDCPACLRGLPHTQAEHEAKLRRVYEASGPYEGELDQADFEHAMENAEDGL